MYKKIVSNCRPAIQVSYVAVRQWLQLLINGFLKKKGFGCWWMLVDISWRVVGGGGYIFAGGGWWWIYLGWWWQLVMDGGGWWDSLA